MSPNYKIIEARETTEFILKESQRLELANSQKSIKDIYERMDQIENEHKIYKGKLNEGSSLE